MYNEKKGSDKMSGKKSGKVCPHCGGRMRSRGAGDTVGHTSFKCRGKSCGRVVWVHHRLLVPPTPLVYNKNRWNR